MKLKEFNLLLILAMSLFITSCAGITRKDKSRNEKQFDLYYGHGTSFLIKKNYTDALKFLLKAYEIDQKNSKLLNNLGMAYYFKGKLELSQSYLLKSVYYDEKNSDARNNLASLYFVKGELTKAEKQYKIILDDLIYQFHHRVHHNLSLIYSKKKQYKKALRQSKIAIEKKDDYCAGNYQLGQIHYKMKNFHKATKSFYHAQMGTCVTNPQAHWHQALSLIKLGQLMDARKKLNAIIEQFGATRYSALANNKLRKISALELIEINEDKKLKEQYFGRK